MHKPQSPSEDSLKKKYGHHYSELKSVAQMEASMHKPQSPSEDSLKKKYGHHYSELKSIAQMEASMHKPQSPSLLKKSIYNKNY
jgi:translation initiation factor 2 alpha subunit (eIF-2alpha)